MKRYNDSWNVSIIARRRCAQTSGSASSVAPLPGLLPRRSLRLVVRAERGASAWADQPIRLRPAPTKWSQSDASVGVSDAPNLAVQPRMVVFRNRTPFRPVLPTVLGGLQTFERPRTSDTALAPGADQGGLPPLPFISQTASLGELIIRHSRSEKVANLADRLDQSFARFGRVASNGRRRRRVRRRGA